MSVNAEDRPHGSGEIGVLKTSALDGGVFRPTQNKAVLPAERRRVAEPVIGDSILVSRMNTPALVGESCYVEEDWPTLFVPDRIWQLKPRQRDSLSMRWLSYVLRSASARAHIATHATGTSGSMKNLPKSKLLNLAVRFPPVCEQRLIAEILSILDTTIRQTEAIIEKLKLVKQGLLHDLLTRGIDENGELRPPKCQAPHLYKDSPLGWLPRTWQLKQFRDLGREPQLGLTVRGASSDGAHVGLLKMGNLAANNQLDLRHVEPLDARRIARLDDYLLCDGDILFNTRNTPELVGKTCSWRDRFGAVVFDNNILRLQVVPSLCSGHFIASYMGSAMGRARLQGLATGTTSVAAIYWKDLRSFELPCPEPQEQDAIVKRLDACDRRLHREMAVATALAALKSGLMDDLLTGRVRVTPLLA